LVVFSGETAVDVREAGTDAVLVAFEGIEVDGVGEVGGEDLVGLGFQSAPVRGQLGEFVGACGEAFIECGLDLSGQVRVLGLADRDTRVAVGDEAFGDRDWDGTPGATGGALPPAGAGEVGVADALLVLREVKLHPRPTGPAEQGPFQVVVVGAHPRLGRFRGVEQGLDALPGLDVDQWFVRAGVGCSFVGHEADVVRVAEDLEERRTTDWP
jgi:hypothetical protein